MLQLMTFAVLCVDIIWASPVGRNTSTVATDCTNFESQNVNVEKASPGQFPWQAGLDFDRGTETYFCSGVIISRDWIVTTARCTEGALSVQIYVGSVQLYSGLVFEKSTGIVRHEHYDSGTLENDIGLVKLTQSLVFTEDIQAISLAEDHLDANEEVIVSGWALKRNAYHTIKFLHYGYLLTISNRECELTYGSGNVFDGMACVSAATNVSKSLCIGDMGSPLVANYDTRPTLVGLMSYIYYSDCEAKRPSGITRISSFRDWIQEKTGI